MNVVPVDAQSAQEKAEHYPEPTEAYAASKWQAEQALSELCANTACLLTIIRPGLIYDAELTANLKTMERLLRWWPLLFPAIGRRSMLARADLVDLLVSCARGNAGAPTGEGIIAATDGECYDAQRISRALSVTTKWGVMPRWLCRMGCRVLDWARGYPAGASWQGLSSSHWYGPASAISGWQPRRVLESRSVNGGPASQESLHRFQVGGEFRIVDQPGADDGQQAGSVRAELAQCLLGLPFRGSISLRGLGVVFCFFLSRLCIHGHHVHGTDINKVRHTCRYGCFSKADRALHVDAAKLTLAGVAMGHTCAVNHTRHIGE